MNSKTIRKVVNECGNITFYQLIKILFNVKVRVLISVLILFTSYSYCLYAAGSEIQSKDTAIALSLPFDLYLLETGVTHKNLYIIQEPVELEGKTLMKIRKIDEIDNTIEDFGIIQSEDKESYPKSKIREFLPSNILVNSAHAQDKFNWGRHKKNLRFYERYINKKTIRRYYYDGWILEYKVDPNNNNRSIPGTFRWIKKGGKFIKMSI